MRRRLLLLMIAVLALLALSGTAHAGSVACVSLNDVGVGACVGDPYPDL